MSDGRSNRFVFLNRPMLSLEAHLGVTASPQAPFPTDSVTLPVSASHRRFGSLPLAAEEGHAPVPQHQLRRVLHSRHAQAASPPRTGGLRWLGVPYVISPTQARFTGQPPNRRSSRLGAIAQGVIRIGRHAVRPPVHRARLLALQAAAYPLMARRGSLLAQFAKNPVAPIAATAARMDRGHLHVQNRVGEGPRAWWPFSPLAIAGARYRRQPAHPGDGKPIAMCVDPGLLHRGPLAKYAAANGMVRPSSEGQRPGLSQTRPIPYCHPLPLRQA